MQGSISAGPISGGQVVDDYGLSRFDYGASYQSSPYEGMNAVQRSMAQNSDDFFEHPVTQATIEAASWTVPVGKVTGITGKLIGKGLAKAGGKVIVRVASQGAKAFKHGFKYHPRIRARALQDPVAHNFPYSFDDIILRIKPVVQSDGSYLFRKAGSLNGKDGFFEIGLNPKTKTIFHRTFVGN